MGECGLLLADNGSVLRGDPVAFAEVSFEPFKKISPTAGTDDKHVSPIVLVSLAAQITERAKSVQGTCDDRFGDTENLCEAPHCVRPRRKINEHEERHLAIGQVRLA